MNEKKQNKIINKEDYEQAFQSNNEINEEIKESVEDISDILKRNNLQQDEFSYQKSKTLTRFDRSYYQQYDKENEVDSTLLSKPIVVEKAIPKEPIKKSYFNNRDVSEYRAYQFKVIMLGNISVGKTCLLSYFIDSTFKELYSCTVGVDFKIKTVVLGSNLKVDLQIWDTSGEERFRTITRQYYRDAAGIILVFDVTNEKSFYDVAQWLDDIHSVGRKTVSIILVGNKSDLNDERVISYETANRFAQKKQIEYFESSAKIGFQVSEIYEKLSVNMVNSLELDELNKQKQRVDEGREANLIDNHIDISLRLDGRSEYSRKAAKSKNCCS